MAELHPDMTPDELKQQLVIRVFETNLIVRTLHLQGVHVDVDLVERLREGHGGATYTEIIATPAEQPAEEGG